MHLLVMTLAACGAAQAAPKPPVQSPVHPPHPIDHPELGARIRAIRASVSACASDGNVRLGLNIEPDGRVYAGGASGLDLRSDCIDPLVATVRLPGTTGGEVSCDVTSSDVTCVWHSSSAVFPRDQIRPVISTLIDDVRACGAAHQATGTVSLRVWVAPDGSVATVGTNSGLGQPTDTCIADVVRKARFPRTAGGSFDYSFAL
jgi:hypothetical protein